MTKANSSLTQERLKEVLDYDPDTGIFTWAASRQKVVKGAVAGSYDFDGYRQVRIDYILYRAHRLAWLYVYGEWPKDQIDHINGVKDDNRISNLRECNNAENQQNRHRANKNNKVGVLGVSKASHGFVARVKIDGSSIHIGSYATPEEAHEAYIKAKTG